MTYRELIELYKNNQLDGEQKEKVKKDIERQEAIGEYLFEMEDIPGQPIEACSQGLWFA